MSKKRPVPKDVLAYTSSGVSVPCEIRYVETDDAIRVYRAKVGFDWRTLGLSLIRVGMLPIDVRLLIDLDGASEDERNKILANTLIVVLEQC